MDTTTTGQVSHAAQAGDAPAVENTENLNVTVKWDKLVSQKLKQYQKKLSKISELTGTLMSLEAMCRVLQAEGLKKIASVPTMK